MPVYYLRSYIDLVFFLIKGWWMKKLVRFTVITSASNFLGLLLVSLKTTYSNLVNFPIGNIYFVESISHTEHVGYEACNSEWREWRDSITVMSISYY